MDDTAAGFPESNAVFCSGGGQEVVDFLVEVLCSLQIFLAFDLCLNKISKILILGSEKKLYLNQVITMDR